MAEERVRKEEMMIEERMKKKLQNQIEIPKCVEDKMQDAYQQIYQGGVRMKPHAKKRIPKWAKAAAAAACVIFAGGVVLVSDPALARDLPLIGNVFDRMEEAREADPYGAKDITAYGNIKDKAQSVDTATGTAVSSGFEISVSDAYCDGYDVYFTMAIRDENGKLAEAENLFIGKNMELPQLKINGEVVGFNSHFSKTETGAFVGVLNIEREFLAEKAFAEQLHAEMEIGYVTPVYPGENTDTAEAVEGEWKLAFDIEKDESANEVFNVQTAGNEFSVDRVVRTPSNLHIDFVVPQNWVEQNPDIRVLDENGEAVQKINAAYVEREDGSQLREYRLQYSGSGSYTIQVIDKNNSEAGYPMIEEIQVTL